MKKEKYLFLLLIVGILTVSLLSRFKASPPDCQTGTHLVQIGLQAIPTDPTGFNGLAYFPPSTCQSSQNTGNFANQESRCFNDPPTPGAHQLKWRVAHLDPAFVP